MRNSMLGTALAGFLFAASPALATIIANLETPEDMQDVSGITLIRGTAFSTMGGPVTVTQRVNGTDTSNVLPCCSPRADVQAANPGAPLNTGFSTQINYGLFDPATLNSIGVSISAPGETTVNIDHQVMVAKPGNAEFLSNFILGATANIAVDVNDIVIGGAQVIPKGGATTTTNLRVAYIINSQSPVITQAFDGANASLFNPVQTIFTQRCAIPGCHDSVTHQNGQDLSAGNSWKNIVAVRTLEDPSRPRVSPGNDDRSYLYQKIIPSGNIAGARMPLGCSGNSCLSDSEIKAIEDWINDGARPPQ
jgi:hypothetical protein